MELVKVENTDILFESSNVKRLLQEAIYKWKIDSIDRAWYISPNGKLLSEVSHRFILKSEFRKEWESLQNRLRDDEIDAILESRLIKTGYVKIGELDNFYVIINKLDDREKNILSGFATSILEVKDVSNNIISIEEIMTSKIRKITIKELSEEILFNV